MPNSKKIRRLQGPSEELDGVVKAEHVVIIFDVVLAKESVDLFSFLKVIDVAGAPFEATSKLQLTSRITLVPYYMADVEPGMQTKT